MQLARNIRELYENCDKDLRKIFSKLTKRKVHGDAFEDLLGAFYLDVWKSNMFRGGFEFDTPEAESCFTPYVYTCCTRFHRNYCRKLFGKKGRKRDGWVSSSIMHDLKGNEVDVFSVAIGANHSTLCSAYTVGTTGGADYLWGDKDPCESFRMEDLQKEILRSPTVKPSEKKLTLEILDDLKGGMEMSEVLDKHQRTTTRSNVKKLRTQARNIMSNYMRGDSPCLR